MSKAMSVPWCCIILLSQQGGSHLLYPAVLQFESRTPDMHPPLTIHRHPMCAEIIEQFQQCHLDHPYGKFFGQCTDLKVKLDRCFRQEKAVKRKANFEESKKFKERLQAFRKEAAEISQEKNVV